MLKTNRKGFTIVELLVILAIIGMLLGLLIPAIVAVRNHNIEQNSVQYTVSQPAGDLMQRNVALNSSNRPDWFVIQVDGKDSLAFHVSNGRVIETKDLN